MVTQNTQGTEEIAMTPDRQPIDVDALTPDQEDSLLESLEDQGEQMVADAQHRFDFDEEAADEGVTVAGDVEIPEIPKPETETQTPPADTGTQIPPQIPDDGYKARYENLVPKLGEMGRIIGELKARQERSDKIEQILDANPSIAQALFNPQTIAQAAGIPQQSTEEVDWMNPDSVNAHIQRSVDRGIQDYVTKTQQQQLIEGNKRFLNNWNAKVQTDTTILETQGVPRELVNQAIANFNKQVMLDGNLVGVAMRLHNFDNLIKEAEKRGAENTVKSLQNKTDIPRRVGAVGSGEIKTGGTRYSNMSPEELHTIAMRTDPDSPEWSKIEKAIARYA